MKTNVIYNKDCLEVLKTLPNKSCLIISDPPYGIDWGRQGNKRHKNWTEEGAVEYGWKKYKDFEWDKSIPSKEYFDEMFRVGKNLIIWGGNYMTQYLPPSQGWLIWDKCQRDFSCADAEMAWTSFDKATRIFSYSRGEHKAHEDRKHPTQKPLKLMEWCLNLRAQKGDIILDPFMGSGTTLVAAQNLGFEYIGCEINKDYYEVAKNRLAERRSQLV
jgi:site-specific DNA-methyltransferase (adenine-specific)